VQVIRHDRIGGMPALEAELYDGPGRIDLVWLAGRAFPASSRAAGGGGGETGRAPWPRDDVQPRYELSTSADGQPALSAAC